ncbi:NAD(P)-binding protein [Polychaeton citri CBS 116435]|uniref:NAD(P)-binding protein n=1 Tax=Polychaeton citri CBS 116435 TaxID=1314669 RepID=A0A9P4UQW2_9PEZI|nr:NAD(P)-binding protein [Polychaeton citri CBS 116435]
MVTTRQWLLAEKPTDLPKLDGPDATFKLAEKDLPALQDDEVLIKLQYLSNDPAQRGWIRSDIKPERLYTTPVQEGTPMRARGLAEVVESRSSKFNKGDTVLASLGWTEYAVLPAALCNAAPDLPGGLSKTHYLGAFGGPGLTAYFGLTEVAKIKPEDVIVISGAAGATGSMAVQIAKNIVGCKRVIGLAGTDEKCKWVEGLGADICLNYKKESFKSDLEKATPDFANVYYDNVGGEILDFMLTRMACYGRIAACGAISEYNNSTDRLTGIKNWFEIISMRISIQGFIIFDYVDKYQDALGVFRNGVKEGKIKVEGSESVIKVGFEGVPKTWMKLFEGGNTGKLVTAIE